jgi:hypothetical protein
LGLLKKSDETGHAPQRIAEIRNKPQIAAIRHDRCGLRLALPPSRFTLFN